MIEVTECLSWKVFLVPFTFLSVSSLLPAYHEVNNFALPFPPPIWGRNNRANIVLIFSHHTKDTNVWTILTILCLTFFFYNLASEFCIFPCFHLSYHHFFEYEEVPLAFLTDGFIFSQIFICGFVSHPFIKRQLCFVQCLWFVSSSVLWKPHATLLAYKDLLRSSL